MWGLFSGFIMGGILFGFMCSAAESSAHRQAVFQEQIEKHGCVIQTVYVNGVASKGDTCLLPDGTILRRGP